MATVEHRARTAGAIRSPALPVMLIFAAMAVGIAALLPLVQSSDATTIGGNVHTLQRERADWQARLGTLEVEVATLGSLARIEQEAARRNMGPPKDVGYLSVNAPPPEERRLPSRYLPQEKSPAEPGSSLLEEVFGWLPLP